MRDAAKFAAQTFDHRVGKNAPYDPHAVAFKRCRRAGRRTAHPSPTFPTGGGRDARSPIKRGSGTKGLHYTAGSGARATLPAVVILGGGCGGRSRLSWVTRSF